MPLTKKLCHKAKELSRLGRTTRALTEGTTNTGEKPIQRDKIQGKRGGTKEMDGGDGGKKSGGDLETALVVRLADVVRKNATENVKVEGERRAKVVEQCERALRASVSETRTVEKQVPDVAHR